MRANDDGTTLETLCADLLTIGAIQLRNQKGGLDNVRIIGNITKMACRSKLNEKNILEKSII
jgi:hypothetical protein